MKINIHTNFTKLFLFCLIAATPHVLLAKTTINFWHTMNNEEAKTLQPIVDAYNKSQNDIVINPQYVSFGEALNKYKISAMAGDAPDLFRAEIAWVAELAQIGVLESLDSFVTKEEKSDFLEVAVQYFQYKDKLWGVPQVTDTLALLYNKQLLNESKIKPPESMDEFRAAAKKLTSNKNGTAGFALIPKGYFFLPFLWAYGGDLIDASTRTVTFETKETQIALETFIDFVTKDKVTGHDIDFVNGYTNAVTGFKEGKYAMMFNGPWAISEIQSGTAFKNPDNLGITTVPAGPKGLQGSPVGGHGYVIYKGSKNKNATYEFLKFLNSTDSQIKFAQEQSLLPTRKSAYFDKKLKENKVIQAFLNQLLVAKNRPVIPEGSLIFKDLDKNLQAALKGKFDSAKAVSQTAKAWRKLIKQKQL